MTDRVGDAGHRTTGMNSQLRLIDQSEQSGEGRVAAELARARRAARLVGLTLPLGITAALAAILLVWLPRMPDPAAVHWGVAGNPDGFGSPGVNALLHVGICLFVTSLSFLQLSQQRRKAGPASWSAQQRLFPATILGTVVLLAVIGVGTSWSQLDARDARETGPVLAVLIGSFVAGITGCVLAYLLQPRLRIDPTAGWRAEALQLAPTEQAVWVREVWASRPFLWIMGVTTLLLLTMTALIFPVEPVGGWIMIGTTILVLAIALPMLAFRVRVDSSGIVARSLAGWPATRVRASDVALVSVAQVEPFAEFGGWGLRFVPGATALVMRPGEALVVTRQSGRRFVVTVDDADTAAALLLAAAERSADHEQTNLALEEPTRLGGIRDVQDE